MAALLGLDERPLTPAEIREHRVRHVMALMAAGQWSGQHDELAELWELHPGTVEHYAGEASRRVKAVGEGPWVRTRISVALDEALSLGLEMARTGDSRALSGLAQLAKGYRELAGARAPEKADDAAADAVFRVELSTPERPAAPEPPPEPDDRTAAAT